MVAGSCEWGNGEMASSLRKISENSTACTMMQGPTLSAMENSFDQGEQREADLKMDNREQVQLD